MTLTDFLLARFDEEEVDARNFLAALRNPDPWRDNIERDLAHIDSRRRVVVLAQRWDADHDSPPTPTSRVLAEVVGMVALPYVDRPEYREGWKP